MTAYLMDFGNIAAAYHVGCLCIGYRGIREFGMQLKVLEFY